MIPFQCPDLQTKDRYLDCLKNRSECGCEYSYANLYMWGRQRIAFRDGFALIFSQYDRYSLYPFPVGQGDLKQALDAIIADAGKRGIPCRISSLGKAECEILEALYPGQFHIHVDRDAFDYVYRTEDLATLKGKKYQSKRNFVNRFLANFPDNALIPLDSSTVPLAKEVAEKWFASRLEADPLADFRLERIALDRAFSRLQALGLEGLILMAGGQPIAMTMGSFLSEDTFDVHFEKALDGFDGAYPYINQSFARHLQEKYPALRYLNREDDMGIPGLRKAKLSYHPDHMVEKYWARLWERDDER